MFCLLFHIPWVCLRVCVFAHRGSESPPPSGSCFAAGVSTHPQRETLQLSQASDMQALSSKGRPGGLLRCLLEADGRMVALTFFY